MPGNVRRGTAFGLCLLLVCLNGLAQEQDSAFDLGQWRYEPLYQGYVLRELLEREIRSADEETLGSLQNLLIDARGQIAAAIVEVGGVWDIGDHHLAVPWDQLRIDEDAIHLPVLEDRIDDYSVFNEQYFGRYQPGDIATVEDDLRTGPEVWKATQLLEDDAILADGLGYGVVTDLLFDRQGQLQAVLVQATRESFEYGVYAFPWYGGREDYGWSAEQGYYLLPFDLQQIIALPPFDYDVMRGPQ